LERYERCTRCYIGSGVGAAGTHENGSYVIDPERIRTFVVPDMNDFKVKEMILILSS
jgi:hypothetical protein